MAANDSNLPRLGRRGKVSRDLAVNVPVKLSPCQGCGTQISSLRAIRKYCSVRCRVADLVRKKRRCPISTKSIGAIGELLVSADLLSRGVDVFRALSPASPCDLVALHGGKLYRVEATVGKRKADGQLTWVPHDENRYDVIAVLLNRREIVYVPDLFPPLLLT
jgi:endogenous inhibitor of DNA gyrase (YacG/DUF329 family)